MLRVRNLIAVMAGAAVLAAAGCDAGPGAPEHDGSWLRASLHGAVTADFNGWGRFHTGFDARRPAAPTFFTVVSVGFGAQANQSISLMRRDTTLPAPGEYRIGAGPDDFSASYQRFATRTAEGAGFTHGTGVLVITESSAERLAGTFRFTARQNCRQTGGAWSCWLPAPEEGPEVEITGSFEAYRAHGAGPGLRLF